MMKQNIVLRELKNLLAIEKKLEFISSRNDFIFLDDNHSLDCTYGRGNQCYASHVRDCRVYKTVINQSGYNENSIVTSKPHPTTFVFGKD